MAVSPSGQGPHFQDSYSSNLGSGDPIASNGWSQDSTSNGSTPAAAYNPSNGSLTLSSGGVSGNSTTYLSDIQPGESINFSFQLSIVPPPAANYTRLSYYLTYTNAQGKQEGQYVSIDVTKSPNTISFLVPKDIAPGSSLGFTLHHEKDWGAGQEVATFSNMQFAPSSGPSPAPKPTPPRTSQNGSCLSNEQECSALSQDPSVQDLISIMNGKGGSDQTMLSDYKALQEAKSQYQNDLNSGASATILNQDQSKIATASQTMLQYFVNAVLAIIQSSPTTSAVGSIALDDSSPQDLLDHVEMLSSMLIQPQQSPGMPVNPTVPSQNYVPPAQVSPNNLINSGAGSWQPNHGTAGSFNPNVAQDSPSGDQNSIVIDNSKATGSDYYEVQQSINTKSSGPGEQYIVAAYVQGPVSNGQGDFLPGGITVSGDINYNGVMYSPQSYDDSAGTNQWHLVYFVVTADKADANLDVSLNAPAGGIAKFSNLQIIPIGSGNSLQTIQTIATGMYPPPSIGGNPGLGPFPQNQSTYQAGSNLMNWPPSQWQNAPSNSQYPYWSGFGGGSGSTLVNNSNGAQSIQITPTATSTAATTTASQVIVPPNFAYTYTCQITIPDPVGNTFPCLDIIGIDYSTTPATRVAVGHWDPKNMGSASFSPPMQTPMQPGTYTITYPIPANAMKNAFQLSTEWSGYKGTGAFSITTPDFSSSSQDAYKQINASNPYDTTRSIYNSQNSTYTASWDFASASGDFSDWGVSLVGNDISNPEAKNVTYVPGKGIVLNDTVNADGSISDAGIQSSFMTAPGQPFSVTTNVQFSPPDSANKPVLALWTYGEAQKGDSSPLSHKSAGGGDTDNECDFELCPPNAQYPNGYFRAVTYAGWDAGGKPHSFINIPLQPGCDVWDGNPHSITLSVNPLNDGASSVTWTVTGPNGAKTQYTYSTSKDQPGYPLGDSATYLKIATEQPYGWPGFTKNAGTSAFTISSIDYTQEPLPSGVNPADLPAISDSDYSYYMPGKGFAYTPFASDFFSSEIENEKSD
jgi:hypothetical protein